MHTFEAMDSVNEACTRLVAGNESNVLRVELIPLDYVTAH